MRPGRFSQRSVWIESDGLKLHGEMVDPEGCETLVVLSHGIPLSLPDPNDGGYLELARRICERGFAALFFNMRGTGMSEGNFHIGGWYNDIEAVMRTVKEELSSRFSRLLMVGFSAGGALSIRYAAEHGGIDGLATVAAPDRFSGVLPRAFLPSFLDMARYVGIIKDPVFPSDREAFYREVEANEAIDFVAGVSPIPLLLVHGEEDELVPLRKAKALYEAAREPKELVLLPEGGHQLRRDPRTVRRLTDWMESTR